MNSGEPEKCPHCGVEGKRVETCDSYRSPHLCPNDHIDHARPDLFCPKCGDLLEGDTCVGCSGVLKTLEYKEYKAKLVEYGVKITSEDHRHYFQGAEWVEAFVTGISFEDAVDEEISYWEE